MSRYYCYTKPKINQYYHTNKNKLGKEIDIKNRTYYFLNGMVNIKNLDPDKIKIDKHSWKIIFIFCIE